MVAGKAAANQKANPYGEPLRFARRRRSAGWSKNPSSAAAASTEARRTLVVALCAMREQSWRFFFTILLNFELRLIQPRIHPAAFHERLMVAFFHNRPSFDDNDAVHVV